VLWDISAEADCDAKHNILEERMDAHWQINEGDDELCLQIELGNDHAVTLTLPKNGMPPTVALWFGCGEQEFGCGWRDDEPETAQEALELFRSWLLAASLREVPKERRSGSHMLTRF
jgi:hypothetical protein